MCSMTGPTHHLQIIVLGEESVVIMSPSMWLHCEFFFIKKINPFFFLSVSIIL